MFYKNILVYKCFRYRIINLDKLAYAGNLVNRDEVEVKPNCKFVKQYIIKKG